MTELERSPGKTKFDINDLQWRDGVALARVRGGNVVCIVSRNGPDGSLVGYPVGERALLRWNYYGRWHREGTESPDQMLDLVECLPPEKVKIRVEFWLNVYPSGMVAVFPTRAAADRSPTVLDQTRCACILKAFVVEEGEGL